MGSAPLIGVPEYMGSTPRILEYPNIRGAFPIYVGTPLYGESGIPQDLGGTSYMLGVLSVYSGTPIIWVILSPYIGYPMSEGSARYFYLASKSGGGGGGGIGRGDSRGGGSGGGGCGVGAGRGGGGAQTLVPNILTQDGQWNDNEPTIEGSAMIMNMKTQALKMTRGMIMNMKLNQRFCEPQHFERYIKSCHSRMQSVRWRHMQSVRCRHI